MGCCSSHWSRRKGKTLRPRWTLPCQKTRSMRKLKNPKGDHLSWAVHMSGMSQFVHPKYQTTRAVLVEIRDAQMSNDQSERSCPHNVHIQLWPSWGCSWAEGARPLCGSTCKYMVLSLFTHSCKCWACSALYLHLYGLLAFGLSAD